MKPGWPGGTGPIDPRHYRLFVYVNPEDPRVLVPKRWGWGGTFNFARPTSWLMIVSIVSLLWAIAALMR